MSGVQQYAARYAALLFVTVPHVYESYIYSSLNNSFTFGTFKFCSVRNKVDVYTLYVVVLFIGCLRTEGEIKESK